ncbi:septum formation initiator family protein [Cellulomonas sp. DKR-3]|uniref:Septum formation initiator family protein n=1 Tax=Cellulomonas fulva TaxID=2835530 RepID=A0ABS5TUR6_9CELL|nr:septum formation initiator family protein [Cellulomonas fulva]MBT0992873.1 septum formation initiator family protein [Cellulomonas fulva]
MQQRTPRLFSVRTIVLGLVLVLAFILVYPTLHTYLRQEVELRALRGEVADARQRNEDLEAELARWDDPAYVTAQARERLSYVLPGETAYRVIDPETVEEDVAPADEQDTPVAATTTAVPWYTSVWDSVEVAGAAPTNEEVAAAAKAKAAKEKAAKEKATKEKDATGKDTTSDDDSGATP